MVAEFLEEIKGKNIAIWGLGLNRGGVESAKFFSENGAQVKVIDIKSEEDLASSVKELKGYPNISFIFGKQEEKFFEDADIIIKNPDIPWEMDLVKKLLSNKKRIESDVTLFFKNFLGTIVGVTGTKGKTTTATLIGELLQEEGKKVFLGGNLKVSLFSFMKGGYLNHFDKKSIAVLELSSFQLEDLNRIKKSPQVAVVTNIYRDHLNRYGNMEKYIKAKKSIFASQGEGNSLILNFDDETVKKFSEGYGSNLLYFSSSQNSFKKGIFIKDRKIIFKKESREEELVEIPEEFMRSSHKLQNLLPSLAVAYGVFGIKKETIKKVVDNFPGVPYRMEKIEDINGIQFFNDTAATIPEAAIGNILSFKKKPILISGGADKDLDFTKLGEVIAKNTKAVVLLPGTATPRILEVIKNNNFSEVREVSGMSEAVNEAFKLADSKDTILLSPGCASFGIFRNEFDRGDQFNEEVKKLSSRQ